MVTMTDVQLAQDLFALVRDQAATDDLGIGMMQAAIDAGSDPFYVIADAISYLDDRAIPADVAASYAAYRDAVIDPVRLDALRALPASLVA